MFELWPKSDASLHGSHQAYRSFAYKTNRVFKTIRVNKLHLVLSLSGANADMHSLDECPDDLVKHTNFQDTMTFKSQCHNEPTNNEAAAIFIFNSCYDDICLHKALVVDRYIWKLVLLILAATAQFNHLIRLSVYLLALRGKCNQFRMVKILMDAGSDVNISKICSCCTSHPTIVEHNGPTVDLWPKTGAKNITNDDDGRSKLYPTVNPFIRMHSFAKMNSFKMASVTGTAPTCPEFEHTSFRSRHEAYDVECGAR